MRAEPDPAVSQFAGAESDFSRNTSWIPQDFVGPARLVYLNCERAILTKARPQFQPTKSAEKTSKMRRNKLMRNIKATVTLATLVAVGAMLGLGVTFPGGPLPKIHAQEVDLEGCRAATLKDRPCFTFCRHSKHGV